MAAETGMAVEMGPAHGLMMDGEGTAGMKRQPNGVAGGKKAT